MCGAWCLTRTAEDEAQRRPHHRVPSRGSPDHGCVQHPAAPMVIGRERRLAVIPVDSVSQLPWSAPAVHPHGRPLAFCGCVPRPGALLPPTCLATTPSAIRHLRLPSALRPHTSPALAPSAVPSPSLLSSPLQCWRALAWRSSCRCLVCSPTSLRWASLVSPPIPPSL
jgi:hypothetical protein